MALRLGKSMGSTSSCPFLSIPEGVATKEVDSWISLSVEYLKVVGPDDRDDGSCCSIYGYIRVNDREKEFAPPVTLFDRPTRDEAATVILGDPDFKFLTLSDDGSARPLWGGFPMYVEMKLWEKLDDDGQEDPVIVEGEFKFDGMSRAGKRRHCEIESDSGFVFYMAYASIFNSVTVRVEFTINRDMDMVASRAEGEEEEAVVDSSVSGKRKHPFLIYGTIAATQSLHDGLISAIKLLYVPEEEPIQVEIGSPLKLDRRVVVAPASGGILGIAYTLYDASTDQLISQNSVPFRIGMERDGSCIKAPESLTFTQDGDDGLVTISITLMPYKFFRPIGSTCKDGML